MARDATAETERSLSTAEVARLLACDPETVLRYAQRGQLRSWRLGRHRRYLGSDVDAFVESRMEPTLELGRIVGIDRRRAPVRGKR